MTRDDLTPRARLTARQREVLRHVADGLPNREIARQLQISEACVKFHVAGLFRHYGVDNRVSVVVRAMRKTGRADLVD